MFPAFFPGECQISTSHKAYEMNKKVLDVAYLKILQLTLPLLEQLRKMIGKNSTVETFKKALHKLGEYTIQ